MANPSTPGRRERELQKKISELEIRLAESEETLRAIREGEVDAIVVRGSQGEQVFSLFGAESSYRLIVETMRESAFTATFDGRLLYCNPQFSQLLNRPVEQVLGHHLSEFVSEENRLALGSMMRTARTGHVSGRLAFLSQSGISVPAHVSAGVLSQPEGQSLFFVASDLTELENSTELIQQLRRQQEALRESQFRLEEAKATLEQRVDEQTSEVRKRASQLRALATQLTRAEQEERRRLAQVLHDHLQQLLVAAKLNLGVTMRHAPTESREPLQQIGEMIDESLAASRSLTMELSPPVLYRGTFAAALHWLAQWMREKHSLEVEVSAEETVSQVSEEIRTLLFQSVRELLFNVVKHAKTSRARLIMQPLDNRQIRIIVEDQGAGFDLAQKNVSTSGSGLGLFAIEERLEPMGGFLHVESVPGKGTRMTIQAPLSLEPAPVSAAETSSQIRSGTPPQEFGFEAKKRIRVVLADDHPVVRDGLCRLITTQTDMEIVGQAADGIEAVRLTLDLTPDVVLMDVTMPGLDGIGATRQILSERPGVCVIGLSMHVDPAIETRMTDAGATCYITKSSPPELLVGTIRSCAGKNGH